MHLTEKSKNIPLVDYIPAELHENSTWEVVYYVFNPFEQKLKRKRNRVKPLKSITQRRQLAKRMIVEINNRLLYGWNPFMDAEKVKEFTRLNDALNLFLKHLEIEFKDGNLRFDTKKTYTSRITVIKRYLHSVGKNDVLCYKFNSSLISDFLDYMRYDKRVSARTRDNYMTFIKTLCNFLLQKKYIGVNPSLNFKKTNKKKNSRIVISEKDREKIFNYFKKEDANYFLLCLVCYYCLIRRTELSKIKVSDVNFLTNTIFIHSDNSKNKQSAHVTMPINLKIMLQKHIAAANKKDYLFSADNYAPGKNSFHPDKCSKKWRKMRLFLKLDENIKWYSLKDTGITDLIIAGVDLVSVRDQARHHSIKQTNTYIPQNLKTANSKIINSGVKF